MQQTLDPQIQFEIKRKTFHLSAIIFPLFYIFIPKLLMCLILLALASSLIFLDSYKNRSVQIKDLAERIFGPVLRDSERDGQLHLSGASYMFAGLFISCLLFSKGLAINAWLILIVSDSLAAIFGMVYGEKLYNGKSYAGSIAFFLSAILVSIFSYFLAPHNISFRMIIVASAITTAVEFYSNKIKINDNFTIPLSYGLSVLILNLL